jgi:hypothetical protein
MVAGLHEMAMAYARLGESLRAGYRDTETGQHYFFLTKASDFPSQSITGI